MISLNMSDYSDDDACMRMLAFSSMDNGSFLGKIKQKPYSVVLFENIESAHSDVLKLISTIIRDGQIITEEGMLISFSGCFIICTSVSPGVVRMHTSTRTVKKRPTKSIWPVNGRRVRVSLSSLKKKSLDFSRFIRGNTIIFRSIQPDAAKQILDAMLTRIFEKISLMFTINLMISPSVREMVEEYCCQDLSRGGISIGQRVEVMLIHPLSRVLIKETFTPEEKVIITHISDSESGWEVILSRV